MSLLKWKELAKSKTELGNKINYVHDQITQHKISQDTSKDLSEKLFKPVTSKLDDVIKNTSDLSMPEKIKKPSKKKLAGIDYAPEVDPFEEMEIDDLFGDYVPPQQQKQIVPEPPSYSESVNEGIDYAIHTDDEEDEEEKEEEEEEEEEEEDDNETLKKLNLLSYEDVDKIFENPKVKSKMIKKHLSNVVDNAVHRRYQLNAEKANNTKKYKNKLITTETYETKKEKLENMASALNDYINHYKKKSKEITGSGIKGRRRKRGGNVMFFNDPKQLLKKLELIIGEVIAGNTSIQMRNTGVNILDTLLKMSIINKPQYNKLYNQYFKV